MLCLRYAPVHFVRCGILYVSGDDSVRVRLSDRVLRVWMWVYICAPNRFHFFLFLHVRICVRECVQVHVSACASWRVCGPFLERGTE